MITTELMSAAKRCRESLNLPDHGVVLLFEGAGEGWAAELPKPSAWKPGTIALAADGCAWRAEGGDDYHGAERWTPIAEEDAA